MPLFFSLPRPHHGSFSHSLHPSLAAFKDLCDPPSYESAIDQQSAAATASSSVNMDMFRLAKRRSWDARRSASFAARPSSKHSSDSKPATLEIQMESPPAVFYGNAQHSTGALLSGQLKLVILDPSISLEKFEMRFLSKVTTKKPVARDCIDCATKTTELNHWTFLSETLQLRRGEHDFPFSYLMPGNLPASMNGPLASVEYVLVADAVTANGEEINYRQVLPVKRAILPGPEKSSVRIFPPTNLTARVLLQPVIYPTGTWPVEMTLSGVVDQGRETQNRWRLKRLSWKIEENSKSLSTACSRHCHKIGSDSKGIAHAFSREIGAEELKTGWKTDFDTPGGEINMQFTAGIRPGTNPICDTSTPNGLDVSHVLTVELIVAEEYCPNKNSKLVTPTGAARVLRMQFHLNLTERAGLGISWDEEQPPLYGDVPASPPTYSAMEDYVGPQLEYTDLDDMIEER